MTVVKASDLNVTPGSIYASAAEPAKTKSENGKTATDANEREEEEKRGVSVQISENLKEMYQKQVESAKEAAKAAGEGMNELAKIIEISRRISNGDKVPPGDEKKLMEYDSGLYMAAKAAAMLHAKEKHKEYDSLFEEEGDDKGQMMRELRRADSSASPNVSAGQADVMGE